MDVDLQLDEDERGCRLRVTGTLFTFTQQYPVSPAASVTDGHPTRGSTFEPLTLTREVFACPHGGGVALYANLVLGFKRRPPICIQLAFAVSSDEFVHCASPERFVGRWLNSGKSLVKYD